MDNNSTVTRLLQVSEEAAPVVQIPIIVGNEMFILTQQDIRRIEDIRHLSYNRLGSHAQISPILNQWNAQAFGNHFNSSSAPATQFSALQGLLPHSQHQPTQVAFPGVDIDMEKTPPRIVANVSKQLSWSKQSKSSSPYPICYSIATSTSGLPKHNNDDNLHRSPDRKNFSCQTCTNTTSQACNTEPRSHSATMASNTETRPHTTSRASQTGPTKSRSQIFKKHRSSDSLCSDTCSHTQEELCACGHSLPKPRSRRVRLASPERLRQQRSKSKCLIPHVTVPNKLYEELQAKKGQLKKEEQQEHFDRKQQSSEASVDHSRQQ
ncbi:uncharacterized protein Mst89B [Drosophila montana]|uniref:uncharacterized protein Mst89B n=1 Tax=Drosophila montana TaxID=40370 RepID=UPI00313D3AEC